MIAIAQCFGIGVIAGCWAALTHQPLGLAWILAAIVSGLAHSDLPPKKIILAMTLAGLIASIATWRVSLIPYNPSLSPTQVVRVERISSNTERYWRGTARTVASDETVDPTAPHGHYLTLSSQTTPAPTVGSKIRVTGTWRKPLPMTNPGQRDDQTWRQTQRISGHLTISEWQPVPDHGFNRYSTLFGIRFRLISTIRSILPEPHASIISAIILGDSGISIPADIERQFRRAGLTHLLVVSGSQVSLVLGLCIGTLTTLTISRRWQFTVGTFLNGFVYGVSGGGVSIFRAVLMSQVMIIATTLRQSPHPLDVLWVTIGTMGIIDPTAVIHPGTYLSFAATAGLSLGVPSVAARLPRRWSDRVKTSVSVMITPTLVTTPIVAILSHTASPISVFANVVAIPLVELSVVVGLLSATLATLGIPVIGSWGLWGAHAMVSALIKVAATAAQVPWATIGIAGSVGAAPIALMGLVVLWLVPEQIPSYRLRLLVIATLCVILVITTVHVFQTPKPFRVVMLDVGQGDATLIQSPGGQTVLIDTGKPGMGDRVITPALRYYGITTLDMLIITHFDDDHVGGADEVISEFSPTKIITNGRGIITSRDRVATHDQIIHLDGGGQIRVMYPNPETLSDDNNHSICARVQWHTMSWLITGDLEAEGEYALIQQFGPDLYTRVLKLGHHGSKTSTTPALLSVTQPTLAVVSAGRRNRYGHPHPTVLNRLNQSKIPVLRTDVNGAIEFNGDTIRTWADVKNNATQPTKNTRLVF